MVLRGRWVQLGPPVLADHRLRVHQVRLGGRLRQLHQLVRLVLPALVAPLALGVPLVPVAQVLLEVLEALRPG